MGGQGKGTADQAIEGNLISHRGLQLPGGLQQDGNPAGLRRGNAAGAGNALVFVARQGVGSHRRRIVLCPHQVAAENLGLQLEVEHNGHTVWPVEPRHFHQALIELVAVLQDFFRSVALQLSGVDTGEGNPGRTLGVLVAHGFHQQFFTHSNTVLSFSVVDWCSQIKGGEKPPLFVREQGIPAANGNTLFGAFTPEPCRSGLCRFPGPRRKARRLFRPAWCTD